MNLAPSPLKDEQQLQLDRQLYSQTKASQHFFTAVDLALFLCSIDLATNVVDFSFVYTYFFTSKVKLFAVDRLLSPISLSCKCFFPSQIHHMNTVLFCHFCNMWIPNTYAHLCYGTATKKKKKILKCNDDGLHILTKQLISWTLKLNMCFIYVKKEKIHTDETREMNNIKLKFFVVVFFPHDVMVYCETLYCGIHVDFTLTYASTQIYTKQKLLHVSCY